jgi:NADH:ubiquinone oxidoreductase subunit 6 (subunit J)
MSVMTTGTLNILIFVAMGAVLAVLVAGIVNLSLTSDKARSRSNQLMRLRVLAQFIAVVLLMVGFWLKSRTN